MGMGPIFLDYLPIVFKFFKTSVQQLLCGVSWSSKVCLPNLKKIDFSSKIGSKSFASEILPEPAGSFLFYLADSLSGKVEFFSYLFQGHCILSI